MRHSDVSVIKGEVMHMKAKIIWEHFVPACHFFPYEARTVIKAKPIF